MEVSLLQHSRDTSPQVVTIGQMADRIQGDQWPPGYLAIRRKPEEINALGRQLAQRTAQPHEAVKQDPEIPDHF